MREQLFTVGGYLWRNSPRFVRQSVLRLTQRTYTVGVVGLVPDEHDAILLLRHRFRTPFQWGLPGGYIDEGETPGQALSRELREEVGIAVDPSAGVLEHELNHASRCISYFVLLSPVSASAVRLNQSELLEFRFCSLDSLPGGLQPTHAEVLRRYWTKTHSSLSNLVVVT